MTGPVADDARLADRAADCTLTACRTCTGCAHNRHQQCRRTVTCPNDRVIRTCGCCGGAR